MAATASNQTLPTNLAALDYVTETFGGQTVQMQPVAFDQILFLRTTVSSGPPIYYCLRQNSLEFWPSAQGGETLTYYGATLPTVMVNDSDTHGLPEPFGTQACVYGAAIEAADFKTDPKLYFYYQQAYGQELARFQTFLNKRLTQNSRAFPVYGPDGRPFGTPHLPTRPVERLLRHRLPRVRMPPVSPSMLARYSRYGWPVTIDMGGSAA